ncbi:MAG TPA: CHAT domain-containing protein [Blastocatellia bacterium]|nr:CHAT domain-containing protein [Blastocatellia bacterium]
MPANKAFRSLFVAVTLWLSACPLVAAQTAGGLLEPDKTIERDLAGGESHTYLITLVSGQLLEAFIAQRQMDLRATLFGPDGRQVGQFDSLWYGPEPVCYVADATGSYRLEVRTVNKTATRGSYQLRLEKLRAPAPEDQTRVAAVKASTEGKQLLEQGKAQTLIPAKKKYEEALPLWRKIGDRFQEAQTLDNIGYLFWLFGGSAKGIEYYNQALAIRQEIKDSHGEGETLNNMAAAYSALGKKELALEYYNRALPLRPPGADLAATLGNIGLTYFYLGQTQKAIEHYKQALPLWRSAGDRTGEVNALLGLGSILKTLGESQQALDYLHEGARIARETNDRRGEAHAVNFLTRLYFDLGEREKALDFAGQALSLFRLIGDHSGEAMALYNQGAVYALGGEGEKALDFYNQALSILRAGSDRHTEAFVLLGLGKLYDESDESQKAHDHYNQALALFRKIKNPQGEALALNHQGLLYAASEDWRKALGCYNQSLPLWRELGDRNNEAATLAHLARAERNLGELNEARRHIEAALAITETLRIKIASRQLRASYLATTRQYHELYIDLLMSLHRLRPSEGHDVAALGASERARARGLLEMLAEAHADISEGIYASLLERERSLQKRINAGAEYQYRLLSDKHTREQMEAAKRELDSLLDESRQVEAEIRKSSPRYAELKYPQPLGLAEIRRMLDPETLLLEYSLGEERSYLWAVTAAGVESFELPKRAVIEDLSRQAYKALASGETGAQLRARLARPAAKPPEWATALSRILLGPIASRLGRKRLVIVADGALQYIPFGALPEPATGRRGDKATGRWRYRGIDQVNNPRPVAPSPRRPVISTHLIANHEIVTLPSASSLAELRHEFAGRVPAQNVVAVIADPVFDEADDRIKRNAENVATLNSRQSSRSAAEREVFRSALEVGATDEQQRLQRLVFSRREADEIMALAGGGFKAVDFAASRGTALGSDLSRYRIIHFATHSLLNSQHPELSGIVLSLVDEDGRPQDGFLRLHDIYNLKLTADLVVLSACKTGLGKEIKGEGLVGLTRGFLYAGAPRVVASLWKVDDRATAELMKLFYRRMLRDGLRPAAALRRAQMDMSKLPRWAAPYYWAGFTLQGEWK